MSFYNGPDLKFKCRKLMVREWTWLREELDIYESKNSPFILEWYLSKFEDCVRSSTDTLTHDMGPVIRDPWSFLPGDWVHQMSHYPIWRFFDLMFHLNSFTVSSRNACIRHPRVCNLLFGTNSPDPEEHPLWKLVYRNKPSCKVCFLSRHWT